MLVKKMCEQLNRISTNGGNASKLGNSALSSGVNKDSAETIKKTITSKDNYFLTTVFLVSFHYHSSLNLGTDSKKFLF